jgi:hypothetical protein
MKVQTLLSGKGPFVYLVRTLPFHGRKMGSNPIRFKGGSSMAEHLTENQKKRVRFSPFTFLFGIKLDVWQNG